LLIPKKSLGQNYLLDRNIAKKIIDSINILNQTIIEIGPGTGKITDEIIKEVPKKLIIIEKDNKLYELLLKKYTNINNVEIFNIDAFDYDYSVHKDAKIISNLPYNISTKLIIKLLCDYKIISEMLFMVQKEVAYKMDYNKNSKNNKLKLIVEATSNFKIIHNLSNKVFYPKPKVQSSIIKIIPKNNIDINLQKLLLFSKEIFKNKRKKIKNIFGSDLMDKKFKKLIDKRAEDLKTNELLYLFNEF
jgi:16S rRNA (adenine1518-N6/adenine1519-N6)-dimethyltransferase